MHCSEANGKVIASLRSQEQWSKEPRNYVEVSMDSQEIETVNSNNFASKHNHYHSLTELWPASK